MTINPNQTPSSPGGGGGLNQGNSGCSGPNTVGSTLITQCQGNPNCVMPQNPPTPATRAACSSATSVPYTSPNLNSNPPQSSSPPVTNTCMCSGYQIDPALGQVCIACRYKDSGFLGMGQKTYYYDGSTCVGGNLQPMATVKTQIDPGGSHNNCKNKMWRGVCSGGSNCYQYYMDPGF